MLGLAEQVGRDDLRVGAGVSDHQDLGRPGQEIYPDNPEELPLGLRDVGVAGTGDHVHRLDLLASVRHRSECLDPAEAVDLVGSADLHRDQGRRPNTGPLTGRGAGDDAFHPGDPRGRDLHVGTGDQRIVPTGHVAADRADRDQPVPECDPGMRAELDRGEPGHLCLGEGPHLVPDEGDVGHRGLAHRLERSIDLGLADPEPLRAPTVQPRRVLAQRRLAPVADGVDDLAGGRLDGGDSLPRLHLRGLDPAGPGRGASARHAFQRAKMRTGEPVQPTSRRGMTIRLNP